MKRLTLVGLGVLLTMTACATAGPGVSLTDATWNVVQIRGAEPVAGSTPTMTFTADTVSGTTGCNHFTAAYTSSGASGIILSPGAMTAMACSDALMQQETAFTQAMSQVTAYSPSGDAMLLQDASGAVQLKLAKQETPSPKPFEGTTWSLQTIRTGEVAASVVAGSSVTMQISGGKLSGKACNTFRADVTTDGDNVTVGPVMSTKMACLNEDLNKQEQTVLDLLGKAASMKITGSNLQLSTGDGDGLDFTAQ